MPQQCLLLSLSSTKIFSIVRFQRRTMAFSAELLTLPAALVHPRLSIVPRSLHAGGQDPCVRGSESGYL